MESYMNINKHFLELEANYLFSTVGKKQREYQAAHPEADVIKLSIGDVTKPLCPAVIEAMHKAVDEMADEKTNDSKVVESKEPPKESVYIPAPQLPTQDAVKGIKFDFNHGIRVLLPKGDKSYIIKFSDIDNGIVLYRNTVAPGSYVAGVKKFFIRYRLEIFDTDNKLLFTHDYDA